MFDFYSMKVPFLDNLTYEQKIKLTVPQRFRLIGEAHRYVRAVHRAYMLEKDPDVTEEAIMADWLRATGVDDATINGVLDHMARRQCDRPVIVETTAPCPPTTTTS
jgi:hypothetical protein